MRYLSDLLCHLLLALKRFVFLASDSILLHEKLEVYFINMTTSHYLSIIPQALSRICKMSFQVPGWDFLCVFIFLIFFFLTEFRKRLKSNWLPKGSQLLLLVRCFFSERHLERVNCLCWLAGRVGRCSSFFFFFP